MIEKVNIPEGSSGDWSIKRFEIAQSDAMLGSLHYGFRAPTPGFYTKLSYKGSVIMSDTPAEIWDHTPFYDRAIGRVLVAGLGLGMVIVALAKKPHIIEVVVVEKSEDVINLVAKHIQHEKIKIVHSDIHDYVPDGPKFDYAWFDIWGHISEDDLIEMADLQRKFKKYVRQSDCW